MLPKVTVFKRKSTNLWE